MSIELSIAHCPRCGRVFQKNLRNLCADCTNIEDRDFRSVEVTMLRSRFLNTEEAAQAANVPTEKIRGWIRSGKLRLADYPNLTDQCDLCKGPIRAGHICFSCSRRIKDDLANALEQERKMKERLRTATFMSRK